MVDLLVLLVRNQLNQDELEIFFSFSKQTSPNQWGKGGQPYVPHVDLENVARNSAT